MQKLHHCAKLPGKGGWGVGGVGEGAKFWQ